jgi:hypothetical protein
MMIGWSNRLPLPGIGGTSAESLDLPMNIIHVTGRPTFGKSPRNAVDSKEDVSANCNHYSFDPLAHVVRRRPARVASSGSDVAFRSFDLQSIPVRKKRARRSSIIDPNLPLPVVEYTSMEPYRLSAHDAPRHRAVFLVEKLHDNVSSCAFSQTTPKQLMTRGTKNVAGLHRGRMGMYLTNQSRQQVHYEEDNAHMNSFLSVAKKQKIPTKIHNTRGELSSFSKKGWDPFL